MTELWLESAGAVRPTGILGPYVRTLHWHGEAGGMAVTRQPVLASPPFHPDRAVALGEATNQAPHMIGGIVIGLIYLFEDQDVELPRSLTIVPAAPAEDVGFGTTTLIVIDGQIHTANTWLFDTYRAAVTIHGDYWVGVLAPDTDQPMRLAWTENYAPPPAVHGYVQDTAPN